MKPIDAVVRKIAVANNSTKACGEVTLLKEQHEHNKVFLWTSDTLSHCYSKPRKALIESSTKQRKEEIHLAVYTSGWRLDTVICE